MAQQSVKETLEKITQSVLNIKDTINNLGMNGSEDISTYGEQIYTWGNGKNVEIYTLQNDNNVKQITIDDLNNQIVEKDNTISVLQADADTKDNTIVEQANTIDSLNTQVSELNTSVEALNNQITEKDTTISEQETTIANREATIVDLNTQITNLNNDIATLNNQILEKDNSILEKDATINYLNNQITSLNAEIESLNEQIANLGGGDEKIQQLLTQIETLEAQIEEKDTEISNLTTTNTELTGQVETLTTEKNNLSGQVANLITENTQLSNQVDSLTTENQNLNNSVSNLTTQNTELQTEVETKTSTIAEYKDDFGDIYNAIVSKGSSATENDYGTYAAGVLAIEGGGSSGGTDLGDLEINNCYQLFGFGDTSNDRSELIDVLLPYCKNATNWNYAFDCAKILNGKVIEIDATKVTDNEKTYFFYKATPVNSNAEITLKAKTNGYFRYAFNNCNNGNIYGLVNAEIEDISDGSKIESFSQMFYNAKNIKSILINANLGNVKYLNETFKSFNDYSKTGMITELDLSTWGIDWSKVLEMQAMFKDADYLTSIKLADNTITLDGVMLNDTFYNCDELKSVNLCIHDTTPCTTNHRLSGMFYGCSELESIISDKPWYLSGHMKEMFDSCTALKTLPVIHIENGSSSNASDNQYSVFYGCSELEEIEIYVDIEFSGVVHYLDNMSYFFGNCSKLKKVKGNFDLTYCYDMDYMFKNCTALETIETTGQICSSDKYSSLTLDLSASAVFDATSFINSLADNTSGCTRTIKLNSTVFNGLSDDTKALATSKKYTLSS